MKDTIRRAQYYHTEVQDRPGEGLIVLDRLREKGIDLLAFSAFPAEGGKAQVDLIPRDPAAFEKACRDLRIETGAGKSCFLVDGADRPGAVAEVVRRLADASINVTAMDAVCAGAGRWGAILWVKAERVAAAAKALGV